MFLEDDGEATKVKKTKKGNNSLLLHIRYFCRACDLRIKTFRQIMCHVTSTSFSWFNDFVNFTSNFHIRDPFSASVIPMPFIFGL